jgi:hypothetical protein
MPNGVSATEFFRQLGVFSRRYLEENVKGVPVTSPWGHDTMGPVEGAILHYTADEELDRVLRWFHDPKWEARASAHVVVSDRRLGSHGALSDGLPLVADLPATVIQCRAPTQEAWHASWANQTHYGVECVSAGELRSSDGRAFTSWRSKGPGAAQWTMPWKSIYKSPVQSGGRWWDPFTSRQLAAVVAVLRYLRDYPGVALKRPHVVGHEQVQSVSTLTGAGGKMGTDKRDMGPTCPLHGIRDAVFDGWRPLEQSHWYNDYRASPTTVLGDRELTVCRVVGAVSGAEALPAPVVSWDRFRVAIQALPLQRDTFGAWGKLGLWLLGYYMPSVDRPQGDLLTSLTGALDTDECYSVWLFQRCMGLAPDGKPGPQTKWALLERLQDRGIV